MRLDHVALTVKDGDTAARFYGHYFGLTRRVHDDDHLLILAGNSASAGLLALSEGDVPDVPRTNHFGFQVDTPAEVLTLRETFAKDGIIEAEFQPKWPTRVQVIDPSGNPVEIYAF